MNETNPTPKKKKLLLLAAGACALAVLCLVLAFAIPAYTGRSTLQGTLQSYYSAMYLGEGGIDALIDCVIPEKQQSTYQRLTLDGTNFSALARWQAECLSVVGTNPTLRVSILEEAENSHSYLSAVQETYPTAEDFALVAFQLDLKGDSGEESLTGAAPMLLQDQTWYVTGDTIELKVISRTSELMD